MDMVSSVSDRRDGAVSGKEAVIASAVDASRILGALLSERGAALVGTGRLPDESVHPFGFMGVVAFAIALRREIVAQIGDGPTVAYVGEYDAVDARLTELAKVATARLSTMGFSARPAPTGSWDRTTLRSPFQLKTTAVVTGLGWIGKTDLLVSPSYGSSVRLGAVLTDAPFPPATLMASRCGACRQCVDGCPAGASKNRVWEPGLDRDDLVDIVRCRAQLAHFGAERNLKYNSICGICIARCPYTRRRMSKLPLDQL